MKHKQLPIEIYRLGNCRSSVAAGGLFSARCNLLFMGEEHQVTLVIPTLGYIDASNQDIMLTKEGGASTLILLDPVSRANHAADHPVGNPGEGRFGEDWLYVFIIRFNEGET